MLLGTKKKAEPVVIRRPVVEFKGDRPSAQQSRPIAPTDGSVARSDTHVSVFCAPCERWVDCCDGIDPESALARHVDLIH